MQTTSADPGISELTDAVTRLVRTWKHTYRKIAAKHTALAVAELATVLGDGERRLGELAEARGVDQSVISRQINELVQRNLVTRRPDPADRRASLVRLTPEGLDLLRGIAAIRQEWVGGALERMPAADIENATHLLTSLTEELCTRANEDTLFVEPLQRTHDPD